MAKLASLPVSDPLKEQLTCGACLKQYTDPRTLPCLHSFCLNCIEKLLVTNEGEDYHECPKCHEQLHLSKKGVHNLPRAIQIASLLDIKEIVLSHQIKRLQQICPEHKGQTLYLYCATCSKLVCHTCINKDAHSGHELLPVSECYPKCRQQMKKNLKTVKKKIEDINSAIQRLATREKELTSQAEDVRGGIQQHTRQLIEEIKRAESDLLQQVDTVVKLKRSSLTEQREQAERVYSQLKSCEEMAEESLRDWSEQEIVLEQQRMINRINTLCHQVEPIAFEPIERVDLEFIKQETRASHSEYQWWLQETAERITGRIIFTTYEKGHFNKTPGPLLANRPSIITLNLQSHDGSPYELPSLSLLTCKLSTDKSPAIDYDIKEMPDTGESIIISFTPQYPGVHQLQVQVGGTDILNSPCTFPVMKLPEKPQMTITGLNRPWGVAVSHQEDIVIAENGAHRIALRKRDSSNLSFGTKGSNKGELKNPRGVAITDNGDILVTDDHRLQRFTVNGVCIKSVGSGQSGSGQMDFNFPVGIAIHHDTKQIFVADSKNDRVQVFANDLSFLRTITPLAPEEFKTPYDVGVDNGGILYVAEHKNHCISKLTTSGEFLCRFGSYGYSPGQLYYPTALSVNNLVYVAEYNSRVSIFDTEGNYLHCFGKKLSGDEKFTCPCGIATDTLGEVCVSDTYGNRVVVF